MLTLNEFVEKLRDVKGRVPADLPVLDAVIRAAEGDWRPLADLYNLPL